MSLVAILELLGLSAITAAGETRRNTELSQTIFFVVLFLKKNMSGTLKNSSDQNPPSKPRIDLSGQVSRAEATGLSLQAKCGVK